MYKMIINASAIHTYYEQVCDKSKRIQLRSARNTFFTCRIIRSKYFPGRKSNFILLRTEFVQEKLGNDSLLFRVQFQKDNANESYDWFTNGWFNLGDNQVEILFSNNLFNARKCNK